MRRLLIDGTNLARIHFAANPALDANGNPVGIIKGFLSAVSRINRLWKPQEIIVFFDGPGGSYKRRKIYPGYKEGRKERVVVGQQYEFESPEEADRSYDWQVAILSKFLKDCAINIIKTNEYETDDGIAYICNTSPADEFLICSCDKDFYQLLSSRVEIYNPIMKQVLGVSYVLEKYQVHPNNWLFYRCIDGDSSDNIPGVKGFGPKTLKKLFSLDQEKKIELDVIPKSVNLLKEHKLDAKEKRLLSRLETLNQNLDLLERNWKIMSLADPLISLDHKYEVDYQIENFSPKINPNEFYAKCTTLDLAINVGMPNEFVRLRR